MDLLHVAALLLALLLGLLLGWALRGLQRRGPGLGEVEARAAEQALVRQGLQQLHQQMRELQDHRVSWQAQLAQQVADVRHSTDLLRRETTSLSQALRRPQVRGRWGELHLRKAVELAGLVERCDFDEQVSVRGMEGGEEVRLRPDLVVNLAGGKHVVVDAKVPLDAFLDATEAPDDEARAAHLSRHSRQFRQHVDVLAGKAYWRSLPATPEFVVLFVPGESFLSAALESDPSLIEYAADRQVILATPTTVIALLRTVAHAWTQEALAEKARDIHRLGRELHQRLGTLGAHLSKVGRALESAVVSYNQAVGSWESRVLVSARRFSEMEIGEDELPAPHLVESAPRTPSASELTEDERSGVTGGSLALGVAPEESA